MGTILVYMTAGDEKEARSISERLISRRLAACTNIIKGMSSMYWWQGEVREESEVVVIAKTKETLLNDLSEEVKGIHSYECPCVVAVPIAGGNAEFIEWIESQTR